MVTGKQRIIISQFETMCINLFLIYRSTNKYKLDKPNVNTDHDWSNRI